MISVIEFAYKMKLSQRAVHTMIKQGMPVTHDGKYIRINERKATDWLLRENRKQSVDKLDKL